MESDVTVIGWQPLITTIKTTFIVYDYDHDKDVFSDFHKNTATKQMAKLRRENPKTRYQLIKRMESVVLTFQE